MDLIHEYVKFCFEEYERNPYGWITKNPPSVAEFREQLRLREQSDPVRMMFRDLFERSKNEITDI